MKILGKYLKTDDREALEETHREIAHQIDTGKTLSDSGGNQNHPRRNRTAQSKSQRREPEDFVDSSFVKKVDDEGLFERLYRALICEKLSKGTGHDRLEGDNFRPGIFVALSSGLSPAPFVGAQEFNRLQHRQRRRRAKIRRRAAGCEGSCQCADRQRDRALTIRFCTYVARGTEVEKALTAPRLLDLTLHFLAFGRIDEHNLCRTPSINTHRWPIPGSSLQKRDDHSHRPASAIAPSSSKP